MDYLDELTSILSSGSAQEGGTEASNCEMSTNDGLDQQAKFELELLEFEEMLMDLTCFPDHGLPRGQGSVAPSKPTAQTAENRTTNKKPDPLQSMEKAGLQMPGRSVKPAQFCHLCWRSTQRVNVVVCSNILFSSCRKIVCEKCFEKFGWDWAAATSEREHWICTHCRGSCPGKAQCYVYGRTNEKRRRMRAALKGYPI